MFRILDANHHFAPGQNDSCNCFGVRGNTLKRRLKIGGLWFVAFMLRTDTKHCCYCQMRKALAVFAELEGGTGGMGGTLRGPAESGVTH